MWWPFSIEVDDATEPEFFAVETNAPGADGERKRLHNVLLRMQQEWIRFDKYYERNHRRYQQLRGFQIIVSALIPISALLPTLHAVSADTAVVISGALGAIATVFASLDSMYRSRESYLRSANTRDLLAHEFGLFSAKAKPYDGSSDGNKTDPIAQLGANVEKILSDELKQYRQDESKGTSGGELGDGAKTGGAEADRQPVIAGQKTPR